VLAESILDDLQSLFRWHEDPGAGNFDGVLERTFMLGHPEPYVIPETIAIIRLLGGNRTDAIIRDLLF
jgi:hypothetical protein